MAYLIFHIIREYPEEEHIAEDVHEARMDEHARKECHIGGYSCRVEYMIRNGPEPIYKIVQVFAEHQFV